MKSFYKIFILFSIFTMAICADSYAQLDQTRMAPSLQSGSNANYYYAKPGDITILVSVWGAVQRPGVYEVSSSTDLVRILSLAGGPVQYAKMKRVRIIRLQKSEDGVKRQELNVNLKDFTDVKDRQLVLYPGDTVIVEKTAWFSIKDVVASFSTVAIFTAAIANLVRAYK